MNLIHLLELKIYNKSERTMKSVKDTCTLFLHKMTILISRNVN